MRPWLRTAWTGWSAPSGHGGAEAERGPQRLVLRPWQPLRVI
jgi:hypothetical protein